MHLNINFFFVAIRTDYERREPEYEVIEGPYLSERQAMTAKDANPTMFDEWEDKRLVVIQTEMTPSWVTECRDSRM